MTLWVKRLLIANIVIFALQTLFPFVGGLLLFVPREALLHPWTIVSYMFIHGGLMHLLFNMIVLFFFGPRVESRLGSRHFILMYLASGITGALLSLVLTPSAAILGASGAVYGVMLAFAVYWPRERIYIWGVLPVEAWLLVALTTGFALYSGFGDSRGGIAHFAHLGGYLGAWIYLWALRRFSAAGRFKARAAAVPKQAERALKENWRNLKLDGVHELSKEEVNRILDKISGEGIASLTPQERLFLSNFVPPDDRKSWVQ